MAAWNSRYTSNLSVLLLSSPQLFLSLFYLFLSGLFSFQRYPVMDQRIFDQLDMLERGARIETLPTRDVYSNSSAEFSAYDGPDLDYHQIEDSPQDMYNGQDEFADQPMTLDSFGRSLECMPDLSIADK